ncbi:MAG: TIGR00153 family protein [Candidatus Nitrosocaldaceae archaeon]|nr:MAG: TIGR00153 family protein [Candidatus Nitrosocaldaceae archaeon]GIU71796.1 MAG: TIGR00153 family protein [Candidatus Nitrosocaldaceae archaeon]
MPKSNDMQTLLLEHMDLVLQTLAYFEEMIANMKLLNIKKAREMDELIDRYEGFADKVHRKNVEKICKGSIFGYLREDILRFMELTDNIADAAKEASRALNLRKIPEDMLVNFLNDNTLKYIEVSIKASKELANLIKCLDKKRDEIIECTRCIEEIEEESDQLKNQVLTELYSKTREYDILTILQFKEFAQLIDAIADNSEDASDVVLIMIAKGYA